MAETLKISISGQGTPLVLLHGWGLNSGIWQPSVQVLQQQFQVITVDLPGFGDNVQHIPNNYSIDAIATLVEQAVYAKISEPAVYLGWSLGGLVATKIALQSPDRVLKLVNVCSSPFFVKQAPWPGIKPSVLAGFHQQLAADTHKTVDGFLKIQAMGSPHLRQDVKQIKQLIINKAFPSEIALDKALKLLEQVDLRAALSQLTVPCLRIYGKLDSLVPIAVAEQVFALSVLGASCQSIVFERSSHAPFISEFELFIKRLVSWLLVEQAHADASLQSAC